MIQAGKFNQLNVIKQVPFGVYLDGGDLGEILLPNKVVPQGTQIFDLLDVFIYYDSEDKIIATTMRPRVMLGGCAFLKVVDVNRVGAFLDWGLDKFSEFPQAAQEHLADLQGKTVVSYCTGGIRCEKAAIYLRELGLTEVYQLDGGILQYFEDTGGAHFEGDCFVFDERVALAPDLSAKHG
jgi:rhodanese-related sulfurtransferase